MRAQAHGSVLEGLYGLYRGIVELHARLVDFLAQLQRGAFIQCTLDSLMLARPPAAGVGGCLSDVLQGGVAPQQQGVYFL